MKIFDWEYYLEKNKDLKSNDILMKDDAIKHWDMFGINESREHRFIDDFNIETYFKKIIDLEDNKIFTKEDAWTILKNIYINSNSNSNSNSNKKEIDIENFDWKYYIDNNVDLKKSGILTEHQALKHWEECGKSENRKHREIINKNISNITYENFDWLFYISNNIDLLDNNILTRDDLWEHWNNYGVFEERKINTLNTLNAPIKDIPIEKYDIDDYIKNENKYDFDNYVSTEEKYNLTIKNTKIVDVPISKNISTKIIKNNISTSNKNKEEDNFIIRDIDEEEEEEADTKKSFKNTKIVDTPKSKNVIVSATSSTFKNKDEEFIKKSLNNMEIDNEDNDEVNCEDNKENFKNTEIMTDSDINEVTCENEENIVIRRFKKMLM